MSFELKTLALGLATLLVSPIEAQSAAIKSTFDITGFGWVCYLTGGNPNGTCTTGVGFTGTFEFTQLSALPFGEDSGTDGATYAFDQNGWVAGRYEVYWQGGSFSPSVVETEAFHRESASVWNSVAIGGTDGVTTEFISRRGDDYDGAVSSFGFSRYTADTTWLADVDFPFTAGLAPNGYNEATFESYTTLYNPQNRWQLDLWGFRGRLQVRSMTLRTVPEPGTLALLGLGLAGLGLSRRHKSA